MEKIPIWLRYILSVPYGIALTILFYLLMRFSLLLYADQNSLYFYFTTFIFRNGINILILFYGINSMLPNHKFKITLILSILSGGAYTILEIIGIMQGNISIEYIIAYVEVVSCLIISCILSCKNKFE